VSKEPSASANASVREGTYHLVGSTNKDGDSTGVGTFLDNEHLVACGTKGNFTNDAC
jgi:hypothetical protein